jgi:hypothetical protein
MRKALHFTSFFISDLLDVTAMRADDRRRLRTRFGGTNIADLLKRFVVYLNCVIFKRNSRREQWSGDMVDSGPPFIPNLCV